MTNAGVTKEGSIMDDPLLFRLIQANRFELSAACNNIDNRGCTPVMALERDTTTAMAPPTSRKELGLPPLFDVDVLAKVIRNTIFSPFFSVFVPLTVLGQG